MSPSLSPSLAPDRVTGLSHAHHDTASDAVRDDDAQIRARSRPFELFSKLL